MYNPQDQRVRGRSLQSEPADSDPSPRRSQSHNGNDSLNHTNKNYNLDQHPQTNNYDPPLNKRHHTRTGTNEYATRSAENTKPTTAHIQQDRHSQLGPSAKRTRRQGAKETPSFGSNPTAKHPNFTQENIYGTTTKKECQIFTSIKMIE